ncbi:MAG TPA: energy transducer TonB [Rhizomicrobium sp.]|nr:energy transducer TonB [Rhizomicrobium sp.]
MLRPNIVQTEIHQDFFTTRRLAIIAAVGVLHVLLVYALVSGLATRLVMEVPNIINAEVIPQHDTTPPPPPPPAPTAKDFETPVMPTVAAPEIKIAHAAPSPITVVQGPPVKVSPIVRQAPPVVVPPVVPPTLPRAVAGTHTQPAYPDVARRLNEQGTVHLNIAVGSDGRVGQVVVTQTSGSDRLDQAAVNWIARYWRYEPATREGKPVGAVVQAAIVFNLTQARQ